MIAKLMDFKDTANSSVRLLWMKFTICYNIFYGICSFTFIIGDHSVPGNIKSSYLIVLCVVLVQLYGLDCKKIRKKGNIVVVSKVAVCTYLLEVYLFS